MVKRATARKIRKAHRYLGIFLGIQFLMWTVSGIYFSWTDIDEIHGDHFQKEVIPKTGFTGLLGTENLQTRVAVSSLQLIDIGGIPYYWINDSELINARTGEPKEGITRQEALKVAEKFMLPDLEVAGVERIESVGPHSEYRGKPLPAYEISYTSGESLKAYVAIENGAFQTVRHRGWRWFDFLWMTHTMDYRGRDDFNTFLLRGFSVLGLITVLSGFTLWFVSSPSIRKIRNRKS
jgi:hypothetical protein